MGETKLRVLIVDDEPLARKFIRRMLEQEAAVDVVGECESGREAVAAVREHAPDLVFLDVQMPEMDGFAALETLGVEHLPLVVFTTAYEQYAIRAFEAHALDYLLKPFDQTRFARAMSHARERLRERQGGGESTQVAALLDHVRRRPAHLERLMLRADGRIIFLKLEAVDWIEADDKYVCLHVGPASHVVRQTLGAVEEQLDPDRFMRIHRSAIVNVGRIKELHPLFSGEHRVVMEDGTVLTLSRNYKDKLFRLLGRPL
ncbi:MAG TPA: LytTR family DNA-binding domain-containing protein [Pyrinomonadaceae bacterium]|jgi:two-component system LytT family response regulator